MKQEVLCVVVRRCMEAESIIIVGAGVVGKGLNGILKHKGKMVKEFFDNNEKKIGTKIDDLEVKRPYKLFGEILFLLGIY